MKSLAVVSRFCVLLHPACLRAHIAAVAILFVIGSGASAAPSTMMFEPISLPAVAGGSSFSVPVPAAAGPIEVTCDVSLWDGIDSDYAFALRLPGQEAHSVIFHGGLGIVYLFQNGPFVNQVVARLTDDHTFQLEVAIDADANVWSVSIDGAPAFANAWNGAPPDSLHFSMAPWISGASDRPGSFARIDNLHVTIPEPTALGLMTLAALLSIQSRRSRSRL